MSGECSLLPLASFISRNQKLWLAFKEDSINATPSESIHSSILGFGRNPVLSLHLAYNSH